MKTVWVVGQTIDETPATGTVWELFGVFDSEEKAVASCLDVNFFVGPVQINTPFPVETTVWPGCRYPKGL